MYNLDKENARKILLAEGLSPFEIGILLDDYPELYDELGNHVQMWLTNGTISDILVDGISLLEVMEKLGTHFLAAIKYLNKLKSPELTPEKKLKLKKILTTPIYRE